MTCNLGNGTGGESIYGGQFKGNVTVFQQDW